MRFDVILYGDLVFRAGTYDEVYSRIATYQTKRQRAAGFRIDFYVDHIDPGEAPPRYGGFAIVDNHQEVS